MSLLLGVVGVGEGCWWCCRAAGVRIFCGSGYGSRVDLGSDLHWIWVRIRVGSGYGSALDPASDQCGVGSGSSVDPGLDLSWIWILAWFQVAVPYSDPDVVPGPDPGGIHARIESWKQYLCRGIDSPSFCFVTTTCCTGPHALKSATFAIPESVRPFLVDTSLTEVTFQYTDPIHALVSMLHFNPLAADWDNLCFTYEDSEVYDDFCNGDRVKRIQDAIPRGSAQLNAVMYFDGIQQDETGFVSVDGGLILGAFFRKEAREQNEAMKSICSFVEV